MPVAPNHKVVLSSHNRTVNKSTVTSKSSSQNASTHSDENGFNIPTYRFVHRGDFNIEDCTNSLQTHVHSLRPKELIVEIDLPLCSSSNNVDLDVCERSLKLHCLTPKYSLDLPLPYPVRESDSHARFDKKQRRLLVTLVVIQETIQTISASTDIDMEPIDDETSHMNSTTNNDQEQSIEPLPTRSFSAIPFDYKQGHAHVALVLRIKAVDRTSFKLNNDGQHVTIELSSIGSGCYPLYYQLCLDFDQPLTFETNTDANNVTFNNDNVLIVLKKSMSNRKLTQFSSGTYRNEMKVNFVVDVYFLFSSLEFM
jgi:hypothetical protein